MNIQNEYGKFEYDECGVSVVQPAASTAKKGNEFNNFQKRT